MAILIGLNLTQRGVYETRSYSNPLIGRQKAAARKAAFFQFADLAILLIKPLKLLIAAKGNLESRKVRAVTFIKI
jgi:hypothetical protein